MINLPTLHELKVSDVNMINKKYNFFILDEFLFHIGYNGRGYEQLGISYPSFSV